MEVELPPPASTCATCSRPRLLLAELRFRLLGDLYSDSHEGAGLEQCEACRTVYVRCWHEVYDEIWRYYSPISSEERRALVDAFRSEPAEAERLVWRLIRDRPALQKHPGGDSVSWVPKPAIVGGPSYYVGGPDRE